MNLKSKFEGCLLGALVGDCMGAPFENHSVFKITKVILNHYFYELLNWRPNNPIRKYTDDTVMMKGLATTIIENKGFNASFFARQIVDDYYAEPDRRYGSNVIKIFEKLRSTHFSDVYGPAKEQFGGNGSYGNGGAMRITPVAVFYHDNFEEMISVATNATTVTHSNSSGLNGALLQCIAIWECLIKNPEEDEFPLFDFIETLKEKMSQFSDSDDYIDQLQVVHETLKLGHNVTKETIVNTLGNHVSALKSVPTAIYCFLRPFVDHKTLQLKNHFLNTLYHAISLGGDTDTIANMACSLVGAYFGVQIIDDEFRYPCEAFDKVIELADSLYSLKCSSSN